MLAAICCYWRAVPESRLRTCLFRESCSKYVYGVTDRDGVRAGLAALGRRLRACRPGFQIRVSDLQIEIVCRDGTIIPNAQIGRLIDSALGLNKYEVRHEA